MTNHPPLGLSVVVTRPDGTTTRWGADSPRAQDVPQDITFRTQRMHGFADGGCSLARPIDRDHPDVGLLDGIELIGDDGSIAYEGRVAALPRSMESTHAFGVQAQGWMAETRRRKLTGLYVDRDMGQWQPAALERRNNLAGTYPITADPSTGSDTTGNPAVILRLTRFGNPGAVREIAAGLYRAPDGEEIGSVYYDVATRDLINNTALTGGTWTAVLALGDTDKFAAFNASANLAAGATGTLTAATQTRTCAEMQLYFNASGAVDGDWQAAWRRLAVYGTHGLTKRAALAAGEPSGLYASDIIRHIIQTSCPKLRTSGIRDTSYPIPHVVFRERTHPYDAMLEVNKYHLWDCSVWENRTVHYNKVDLTDYDWEVRLDDPGVSTTLQGDEADDLANGIVVEFDDLQSGRRRVLTPTDYAELRDESVENPLNQHGDDGWTELALSTPTIKDAALEAGRAALAEHNQPKAPGTITVRGHVRNRQGHWQPVWKVRAGDRVVISSSSSLSDRPRMIQETTYTHDGQTATIAVDSTFKRLEAVFDRLASAVSAAGIA